MFSWLKPYRSNQIDPIVFPKSTDPITAKKAREQSSRFNPEDELKDILHTIDLLSKKGDVEFVYKLDRTAIYRLDFFKQNLEKLEFKVRVEDYRKSNGHLWLIISWYDYE
jgi:hypothetical protein